jgi:murein DD-endopeptidase MepM/ murein hydrolase activator NlpD
LIKFNVGGRDLYFHYCHLQQSPQLTERQKVYPGDVIGHVGNTGRGTGAHLHLEVWATTEYSSSLANPHQYLP